MPTLSVKISQEQEDNFIEILERNPGWDKTLVTRALLAFFVKLKESEQVELVKKYRIIKSKNT